MLLENKGILPLDVAKKPKVAVIGPTADDQLAMFSGYSFPVHLIIANMQEERVQYAKTPLQALTERFGGDNVSYAKGCEILTERNPEAPVFPGDVNSEKAASLERRSPVSRDTSQIEDAVAARVNAMLPSSSWETWPACFRRARWAKARILTVCNCRGFRKSC